MGAAYPGPEHEEIGAVIGDGAPSPGGKAMRLPQLVAAAAAVSAALTVVFGVWTCTSIWSFPRFLAAVLLLAYLPGKMVLDLGGFKLGRLDGLTLSLLCGMALSALVYWTAGFTGMRRLFLLWPIAVLAVCCCRRRRNWREFLELQVRVRPAHVWFAVVAVLGLIPFVVLPSWYRSLCPLPDGGITYPNVSDSLLHLAITNEVTHTIPPQFSLVAGLPLTYHYGMDVICAMFSCAAGLSVADLTVRFLPTLYLLLAVTALFCFSRAWLRSEYAAVLTVFLVVFGEDFSYIPGWWLGHDDYWCVSFFQTPATFCLHYPNPMLPALAMLFAGLLCLLKFCRENETPWLVLMSLLIAVQVEFKVFVASLMILALAATSFIHWARFRDAALLKALALTAALAAPLLLYVWFCNSATATQVAKVELRPHPFVADAFTNMFLGDTRIGRDVRDVYAGILSLEGLAALFLVGLPVYLLGSLGLRVIAIPRILKELLRPGARTAQRTFLAAYVLLGLVVTLTCTVSSECGGGYNNAVWFWTQSKLVAWVFVVEIIWSALEGKGAAVRALVLGLVAALSIPSTVQQLAKQAARPMVVLDKNTVELVHFIERLCSHGEVVFAHESLARAIVTMTKCRVPLEERDCVLPAPEAEVKRRRRDLDDFWNTDSSDETRAEILHRYNTAYLVLEKKVNKLSPLPPPVVSRPLFENEDFVLYMVRKPK